MRCLASLALALLALKAALRLAPALPLPGRAGVCSELSSFSEDSCTISCVNDENCPQDTRCCTRSPCTSQWTMKAWPASPLVPVPKAGCCPRVQALLAPKLCLERNECSRDDQCMENQKCCFSSCAMRCVVPATEGSLQ
uniref:WAP domain-containing protein n=1 Tax=Monodon monoceros TaxID=40151 RepID=A0A8C6BD07_MONMO